MIRELLTLSAALALLTGCGQPPANPANGGGTPSVSRSKEASPLAQTPSPGSDTGSDTGSDAGSEAGSGAPVSPAGPQPPKPGEKGEKSTQSGLSYTILQKGSGDPVAKGDMVKAHYTGWLTDGKKFDSSLDPGRGEPLDLTVGVGQVIPGWDEGLQGMKVGEVRRLYIPSKLAYGPEGGGEVIPPDADLVFEVLMVSRTVPPKPPVAGEKPKVSNPSGLGYTILTEGSGPATKTGDLIRAHYTGWLTDGTKFDSSLDRGQPFDVTVGVGQVIKGWDEGLVGMKKGEVRRLYIPYKMAYGDTGSPPAIPPKADLVFEVELVDIVSSGK